MSCTRQVALKAHDQEGRLVFARVIMASSFLERLRGLLGRPTLDLEEAWWFRNCSSVHTFGMTSLIDVLHLSREVVIEHIHPGMGPRRVSIHAASSQVVEARHGAVAAKGLTVGQRLRLSR